MKRQNRIAFFNILSTVVLKGSAFFTGMLFTRLLGGSGYGNGSASAASGLAPFGCI